MLEEQIILLIKASRHREAIKKYVDANEFEKAEDFCINKDKSLGLITTLLSIYFQQYDELMAQSKMQFESGDISKSAQAKDRAQKYEWRALNLMRNQKAKT